MLTIAICDDDRAAADTIESLLQECAAEENIEINCEAFYNGAALAETAAEQAACFDIVYLDIEMDSMNGIQTARALRKQDLPLLLIYVSGHEEYLKELFATEPFRFLSKPIDREEFHRVFSDACRRLKSRAGYFSYNYNKTLHKIPFSRISYFESRGRRLCIHTVCGNPEDQDTNVFYGKMNVLEHRLPPPPGCRFLRIHQSFLVNFDYIKSIGSCEIIMMDGTALPISEERRKTVKTQICLLLNDKGGLL